MKIISELWKNIQNYFYFTARPRYINPLDLARRLWNRKAYGFICQKHPGLALALDDVIRKSKSTGCEYGDYLVLYRMVQERCPAHILECGSGVSTVAIAYALKELEKKNGSKAVFVSCEENPGFYREIQNIFPEDLKPYVKFTLSKRGEGPAGPYQGCFYESVPDDSYDFIFIDGPTLRRKEPGAPKCVNTDLIRCVLRAKKPVTAVMDQRIGNFWAYQKLIPGADIRYDAVKKLVFISNATRASLNPAILKDLKLQPISEYPNLT